MNSEKDLRDEQTCRYVLGFLPDEVSGEIRLRCLRGGGEIKNINEIRLRANAPSVVLMGGRAVALNTRLSDDDIDKIYMRLCRGAPFAKRECIINGYIPLEYGVRVGVAGEARYDGGVIVGVGRISLLVFRLPQGKCGFAERLYRQWRERGLPNMLVCSAPAVGKTTALRALARLISLDMRDKNVVVVDERCEFSPLDYSECNVDILVGYKRWLGIDIAIRTLSAHYLVVDEIGRADECDPMLAAYGCGVGILASAHGDSLDEIRKREWVEKMLNAGIFRLITIIKRGEKGHFFELCEV